MEAGSTGNTSNSDRRDYSGNDNNKSKHSYKSLNGTHGHHSHPITTARDPRDELAEGAPKKAEKAKQQTNVSIDQGEEPDDQQQRQQQQHENGEDAGAISFGIINHAPNPAINSDGLSRPSIGTHMRLNENSNQADERLAKMCGAIRTILECIGEDVDREGLLATPSRYAEVILFLTKGYQQNVRDIVNKAIFEENHNEMIIVNNIEISSMCEHHLVPFIGKMHIGYIPNGRVIGLSKLPRIAEIFARRLQIQERLTKEVATTLMEILEPQGVAVVMEASHLCMVVRGVEKTTTSTITSCVLGCFESMEKTRSEFLTLIGLNKWRN